MAWGRHICSAVLATIALSLLAACAQSPGVGAGEPALDALRDLLRTDLSSAVPALHLAAGEPPLRDYAR